MNRIRNVWLGIAVAILGFALALCNRTILARAAGSSPSTGVQPYGKSTPVPVVVELFTSEGCSSCPPADALLARLGKGTAVDGAQIIPLEEHVDYWNHLGWADPFSDSRYTARQRSYAQLMHLDQVYTPQMVVDGRRELLGSDEGAARSAITESLQTAKATASITVGEFHDAELSLNVRIAPIPTPQSGEPTDVIVAITEDGLQSNVSRGENAGRRLAHVGVVRTWQIIGHGGKKEPFTGSAKVTLESSWKKPELHAVLFVQGHDSGRVYGADIVKIEVVKRE